MKSEDKRVIFQPATYQAMQRGVNQIVEGLCPTLGPRPGIVAIEQALPNRMPELLDNGALIARRIIQLPDRDADMGAMFLRHLLWRLYQKVGDGTATAAVLFQSIFDQGVRYVVAGGNAMQLRHHLECGVRAIVDELVRITVHLEGKERLTQIAETICYDAELAKMLGEIVEMVGAYGQIDIRTGRGRELEREYVEGMYWQGGVLSREMITDPKTLKAELTDAGILITDLEIEDPRQLVPALETAVKAGVRSLVVANKLSEKAIGFLLAASRDPYKLRIIAAKTPGLGTHKQAEAMEELAILTGGRPVIRVAGDTLEGFRPEDLGRVRKAWADRFHFGIVGGKGDPRKLRAHIQSLRAAQHAAENPEDRTSIQERIGRLMGGSATLWAGGTTELEIEARKEMAKRTVEALRGAILEGVIPGGGVSLLACQPVLRRQLAHTVDEDERAAYHILLRALETPIRTLLSNDARARFLRGDARRGRRRNHNSLSVGVGRKPALRGCCLVRGHPVYVRGTAGPGSGWAEHRPERHSLVDHGHRRFLRRRS